MTDEKQFKHHLERWCTCRIDTGDGAFDYQARLIDTNSNRLTFESKDGRRKTFLIENIKEITSTEYKKWKTD